MFLKFNSTICRVCLEQEGEVSLFDNSEIAEEFRFCTLLEASEDDELPSKLCAKCFKCLKIANNFKTKAISSDTYIRKFLSSLNAKFSNVIANNRNILNVDMNELNSLLSSDDQEYENIARKSTTTTTSEKTKKPAYKIEIIQLQDNEDDNVEMVNYEDIVTYKDNEADNTINEKNNEIEKNDIEIIHVFETDSYTNDQEITKKSSSTKEVVNRKKKYDSKLVKEISTSNNPCICVECNKTFSSKANLMRHVLTHNNAKPYQCSICGDCFTQSGSLKNHMLRHTGERPYGCDICGKSFARLRVLRIHERIHTGDKPYECSECGEKFRVKEGLRRHNVVQHSIGMLKEYDCPICERKLSSKCALDTHLKLHRGEKTKNISCNICNKTFSSKYTLQTHLEIHQKTKKKYQCKQCNEEFQTRSLYFIHIQKHNDTINSESTNKFICEICNKVIYRKFQLYQHLLTHENKEDLNYQCRICDEKFTVKENILQHLRGHNNFIHKCDECNIGFNIKRDLKLHRVNFHKETVPDLNKCEECDIIFVSGIDLNVHLITKHDEINCVCKECGELFKSNRLYKEHVLEHDLIEINCIK